jgi:hypothetical protein
VKSKGDSPDILARASGHLDLAPAGVGRRGGAMFEKIIRAP